MSADALLPADAQTQALARLGGTAAPAFNSLGWDVDGDTVVLRYEIEGLTQFTEKVQFPGHDLSQAAAQPATAGALTVLQLTAMTSYYKTVIPALVRVGEIPPTAAPMLQALLTHGLAEFAVSNSIDPAAMADHVQLHWQSAPVPEVAPRPSGVLVPIGGGKDSAVSAMLARRNNWDAVGFSVNPRPSMHRTAKAVGVELIEAKRQLDPKLFEFNRAGALNGHIPITAIVASIGAVAATLTGRGDVLLSNEASADEPTRIVNGYPVNHQYSKSSAFESLHRAAMIDATGGATEALSVLRPLPELLVAAAFAALDAPLSAVNSCNRAYALEQERREWCGECPKCLFVQLMLAPFTTPDAFTQATGFDALAREDLVERFTDLTDPVRKPFECVGTVEEVQLAFDLLTDHPGWARHAAVVACGHPHSDADSRLRMLAESVDTSMLAPRYRDAIDTILAELGGNG